MRPNGENLGFAAKKLIEFDLAITESRSEPPNDLAQ